MNFCPKCGHPNPDFRIPPGDHLPRYICDNCHTIHYENPNMIVGCLPVWEDKVMIAKRGIEPRKGLWNLPCGFLESEESVEQGAVREVFEETGAQVELDHLLTVYNLLHEHQVYLIFLAHLKSPEFHLTEESTDIQLFKEEEVPWDQMAFTSSSFTLKNYFEDRKTGVKQVHFGTYDRLKK